MRQFTVDMQYITVRGIIKLVSSSLLCMCHTAHAEQLSHASTWILKVFMNYLETIFSHNKRIWKISVYRCCFSFMKWDNSLLIVRYNKPSLIQSDIPWFQFCRSQLRDCNIPSGCRYIRVSNSTCSEWLPVQNSLLKSAILSSHRLRHVWIVHLWWPHCDEDGC